MDKLKQKIIKAGIENVEACIRFINMSPTIDEDILIKDFKMAEGLACKEAKGITDHIIKMETGKVHGSGEEFNPDLEDRKESIEDATNKFIKNIKG